MSHSRSRRNQVIALAFNDAIFLGTNLNQINVPADQRSVNMWFNTSVSVEILCSSCSTIWECFRSVFAGVRTPNQTSCDFSVTKFFSITERAKLQFRASVMTR
ncbi:MAG: hypothetical protein JO217_00635 [Acidobacteriaceae bacterium]|nr:hypothetical protein [Acidobacteriaceae bacterium]